MTGPPKGGADRTADSTTGSDEFVERLADRLSGSSELPAELPPDQTALPSDDGAQETSDVHQLNQLDDALEVPPEPSVPDAADAFAEFEDELEAEATRIDDSNLLAEQSTSILEPAPAQPFLAVESGNDLGREFVLQEGENGVGRGIDNDVILADVAVSRRHLRIIREGDVLTMRDLGSGNGTLVNGQRETTVCLVDGDRLELGETTLVVRLPGAELSAEDPYQRPDEATDEQNITAGVPAPSDYGTPSNPLSIPNGPGYQPELTPFETSAPTGAGSAVPKGAVVLPKPVLFAMFGGVVVLFMLFTAVIGVLVFRDDEPEPETVVLSGTSSHYDLGVRAFNEQRWGEARREFELALAQPTDGTQRAAAQNYADRTRLALRDQPGLETAQRLRAEGDLAGAATAAAAIDDAQSPVHDPAQRLLREVRGEQALGAVTLGAAALRDSNIEEARRQLEIAAGFDAASGPVQRLRQDIAAASGEPAPEESAETDVAPTADAEPDATQDPSEPEPSRGRAVAGRSGRSRRGGSRPPQRTESNGITRGIITRYLAGSFTQAAGMADTAASASSGAEQSRLMRLGRNIRTFGRLWPRIQAARFSSRVQAEMQQAMALDAQIAHNAHYRNQLRQRLVAIHLGAASRSSRDVERCRHVRSARLVDPRNSEVRSRVSQCESIARGMMSAAAGQSPARQATLYRQILGMVPPSSSIANDARQRLNAAVRRSQSFDDDE